LRNSVLRDLPAQTLAKLAVSARWVHPRSGQQLVMAGRPQAAVFAVVDGAVEGRAPSDPGGTVRERVGAGGLVGLGAALSGTVAPLNWYTAGTTLLAMPANAVTVALGRVGGGSFGTSAEAEAAFAASTALTGLSHEDRLGLSSVAVPISLAPGATLSLSRPDEALVLTAGTLETFDGRRLGRGTLIGPVGQPIRRPVAVARSAVRLFSLPTVSGLPLLLGTPVGLLTAQAEGRGPGRPPVTGVHPVSSYPPLAIPPGPPPAGADRGVDRRFEKKLRWLLILVLLLALLFTAGNLLLPVLAWAEMPTVKALVRVETGSATAVVRGLPYALAKGDQIYVGADDDVRVDNRSQARVIYRGGGVSILCGGTRVTMGSLGSSHGRPVEPYASLVLATGQVLMDTRSTSPAFVDLASSVTAFGVRVVNRGPAWYSITRGNVEVSEGVVAVNGETRTGTGRSIGCPGSGTADRPSGVTAAPVPTDTPTTLPSPSGSPLASAFPSPSPSPTNTTRTSTTPPRTTTTNAPPPDTVPVVAQIVFTDTNLAGATQVAEQGCGGPTEVVVFAFIDDDKILSAVGYTDAGPNFFSGGPMELVESAPPANGLIRQEWRSKVNIGPFAYDGVNNTGTINVTIVVQDTAGHQVTLAAPLHYADCVNIPR
jgi:putative peptide zinc metalloprotease protein